MRAVCVECADKERKTDSEADGDDKCAAGCAEAKYPRGHNLNLLVLVGCAVAAAAQF